LKSDTQYLRLETTGRRTQEAHNVLVRFILYEGRVVIFPQNVGGQDWVENVRANPKVRLFTAEKTLEGSAGIKQISGLRDPLLGAFTRKYGDAEVRKRYWGQTRYVEVEISSQSRAEDYEDLYYSDLEAAFDGVAEHYDEHILGNPMNVWLRNRSVHYLSQIFKPGDTVLEIGCGTGTETILLARHGLKIIAADISSKMLEVLAEKAKEQNLSEAIVPLHTRTRAIKETLDKLGYSNIAGAYSTYGAINTEPKLSQLFGDLHSLIRPGGHMVLGVWNRYYLYEMLGYSLRLKPAMALARLRNPVPVGKSRFCITSYAYSVGSLREYLTDFFELKRVFGIEILLPPSNLTRYLPPEPFLTLVKRIDIAIEPHFPWNRLGDHFLAVYARV
jgi:2-polyprenyl-3-methyl-5-hydroxy-6-metoxy-1,4-benzoquinol methylase